MFLFKDAAHLHLAFAVDIDIHVVENGWANQ